MNLKFNRVESCLVVLTLRDSSLSAEKISGPPCKEAMVGPRFRKQVARLLRVLTNQTIYTSTINNCGGVPNGVWSVDIKTVAV